MELIIRRALVGDAPALARLNAFIHDLHVTNNPAYFKPAVLDDVAAWFRHLLEKPTTWVWIAETDGEAVGYVAALVREQAENAFGRLRRWVEIDQIGVRADQRRKGLARALADVVLEASAAEDIRDVELSCWVFNVGAQEAFRKLGFTPKVVRFGRESSRG